MQNDGIDVYDMTYMPIVYSPIDSAQNELPAIEYIEPCVMLNQTFDIYIAFHFNINIYVG